MEPAAPYATAAVAAEETSSRPDGAPSSRRRSAAAADADDRARDRADAELAHEVDVTPSTAP